MSWHPNDLVTDADLVAYEATVLAQFGVTNWQDKRAKALNDWLWPILDGRGFDPDQFRTRYVADQVWGYTSSVFTDLTAAASNDTADDINLAAVLAASSDYLYIGSARGFRGVSVRMADSVSTAARTLTTQVWADAWQAPADVADGTALVPGKPFSGGGALTWVNPERVTRRPVNGSGSLYWVRLSLSGAPTSAAVGQIAVIRRSRLRAPVTFRTLSLIFAEAPTSQSGPWREKRDYFEREAEQSLERVMSKIGGEFDTSGDDVIDATEAQQTAEEVAGGSLWTVERY